MFFIILLLLPLVSQALLFCLDIGQIDSLFLQCQCSDYIIPVFYFEHYEQLSIFVFLWLFCCRISKTDKGVFVAAPIFLRLLERKIINPILLEG